MGSFRTIILTLYTSLLFWWLSLFFSGSKDTLANFMFGFSWTFMAFVICVVIFLIMLFHIHAVSNTSGKIGLLFMNVSVLVWLLGNLVWNFNNLFFGIELPFPSSADFFFFTSYFFTIMGFSLMFLKPLIHTIRYWTFLLVSVYIYYILALVLNINNKQYLTSLLNSSYVFFDSILIFGLISYFLLRKFRHISPFRKFSTEYEFLLLLSIFCELFADVGFWLSTVSGSYFNGGLVDLFFLTYIFVFLLSLTRGLSDLIPPLSLRDHLCFGHTFLIKMSYYRPYSLNMHRYLALIKIKQRLLNLRNTYVN